VNSIEPDFKRQDEFVHQGHIGLNIKDYVTSTL